MKLNLGCGLMQPLDWENVDKLDYGQTTLPMDIIDGLAYDDESFEFVLMNHVLQMFTYDEHEAVLKEVRRVLRPGGTLRILVPDLDKAVGSYESQNYDYFPISDGIEVSLAGKFARYLFWHGETRCAFNFPSLNDLLFRNGFTGMRLGRFGECELDSRESESLIMEAIK